MNQYRNDFPLLRENPVIYLDSAATTQRPDCVLKAELDFYTSLNANPLRGLYDLSMKATQMYEQARRAVKDFIGAEKESEIIFTRNTTESINLVAYSYACNKLKSGDEILITIMEHHSNILPWQMVAERTGATLRYIYCDKYGMIHLDEVKQKLSKKTKLMAVAHISNVLGCMNSIETLSEMAHDAGAVIVVDGAQSIAHMKVDVKRSGVDFFAFSGHKMYGPFGIGVLYGKEDLLEGMTPFLRGGEMIDQVSEQTALFAPLPHKFEAGTSNPAGAAGLLAAIEYIQGIGYDAIEKQEQNLIKQLMEGMKKNPHVRILGSENAKEHYGIVSFTVDDVHPHDGASILNETGVAVRAGYHCAEPLLKYLNISSTLRASVGIYNTEEEICQFLENINRVRSWMGYGIETNI